MFEQPPILRGETGEQLAALRDYLVRLARSLEALTAAPAVSSAAAPTAQTRTASTSDTALRSLIVKTADTIRHELDAVTRELHENYLALSDFGSYRETAQAAITETARGVVESYRYDEALEALTRSLTTLRGQIRRGLLIVIGQDLNEEKLKEKMH